MHRYILTTEAPLTLSMKEKILYHASRTVPEKNPNGPGMVWGFKSATISPVRPRLEVFGRRWFQQTYGNTYHSVRVLIDGVEVAHCPYAYGYGDSYSQTAVELLKEAGIIPQGHRAKMASGLSDLFEVVENVEDVNRKKDL